MSDAIRLVNQQLAFAQRHLEAAATDSGFDARAHLQAAKLQLQLALCAYIAEICQRINQGLVPSLQQDRTSIAALINSCAAEGKATQDLAQLHQAMENGGSLEALAELPKLLLAAPKLQHIMSPLLRDTTLAQPMIASSAAQPLDDVTYWQQSLREFQHFILQQRQTIAEF